MYPYFSKKIVGKDKTICRGLRDKLFLCFHNSKRFPLWFQEKKFTIQYAITIGVDCHVSVSPSDKRILINMNVLPTNRSFYKYICTFLFDHETSGKHRALAFLLNTFFLCFSMFIVISSILYVNINVEFDVNKAMYAIIQICAIASVFFPLVHAYINRRQIDDIFVKMEKIYDGMHLSVFQSVSWTSN